jgi:hypothetical protein
MIDFDDEIEAHLRHFQYLTGKGNVKDAHKTLYEILRLMLGMMSSASIPPGGLGAPHFHPDPVETPSVSDPTIGDEHRPPCSSEPSPTTATTTTIARVPLKNAPYGLTKFGNPRRIRSNNRKPQPDV